jgi:2'-5' RNA ligase
MTLPSVVRVFFAIDLPQAAKQQVDEYMSSLKKEIKSHAIRWSRPENLHITLQFLAEVESTDLNLLLANVKQAVSGFGEKLSFELGALRVFPDPYRPRVIVLDVSPQAALTHLSEAIGQGIRESHYQTEDRPFRAHLTLGRIKQPKGLNLGFLQSSPSINLGEIDLHEVVLFRSEPQPEGSRYSPIERIAI